MQIIKYKRENMKNAAIKLLIGFVMLAGFSLAHSASAAFNTLPVCSYDGQSGCDKPLVRSKVATGTNTGYAVTTSGVNPGDTVAVILYFHNTGTTSATNTKFTLTPQVTGSGTTHVISGTLSADGFPTVSGSTTINLTQASTLTFTGVASTSSNVYVYYDKKTETWQAVQMSGLPLFGSGLNIGTIAGVNTCPSTDSFCHQGTVVLHYKVGSVQTACTVNSLSASPTSISSGGSSVISWSSTGATSATLSGPTGTSNVSTNGSQTVYPTSSGNYTLTVNCNGQTATQSVYISVNQVQQCYINSFTASPTTVSSGGSTVLNWSSTGATSATIAGPNGTTNVSSSGSQTFYPTSSGNYTLTVNCNGQTTSQSVYVSVNQAQQCFVNSFYASPSTVNQGGSTTLYWSTTATGTGTLTSTNGFYQTVYGSGSQTVTPTTSTTYTLTFNCASGGSTTQTVFVTVSQPQTFLGVMTSVATSITSTSARLNGLVTTGNGSTGTAYFEWGATASLGFTTNPQTITATSGLSFFDTVTGLVPNTYYYYRAVLTSNGQTVRGDISIFHTLGGTPTPAPTPVVVVGTGTGSTLIALSIDTQAESVCVGDELFYTVKWKNISTKTVTNIVLHIDIPKDVEFRNTSMGIYNSADRTLTLDIGTLIPSQEGQLNFTGIVLRSAIDRDLLVTTATIGYKSPTTTAQESAIAYELNNTGNCPRTNLAGLALFGGDFFPTTLIGWLLLILVILALIYVVRRLYQRTRPVAPHYETMDIPRAPYHN